VSKAHFPEGVNEPVQYGPRIKSVMVYMSQYQLLPYNRLREFFADVFKQPLSAGTIYNANQEAYRKLEIAEEQIKQQLQTGPLLHVDETGLQVTNKLQWLHVRCNSKLTYFAIHEKRGSKAFDDINLLAHFNGTMVHDHFKSYFNYGKQHALCNAHHLRELTFVQEHDKYQWAFKMEKLLLKIKQQIEAAALVGQTLSENECQKFQKRYMNIIYNGRRECPPTKVDPMKKGRGKQSKAFNLLERLRRFHDCVLAFMYDPSIPFDNNQAERDIRMTKVRQKISGCFRSQTGAMMFCRIRGYISTARKNSTNILFAIEMAMLNQPILFEN